MSDVSEFNISPTGDGFIGEAPSREVLFADPNNAAAQMDGSTPPQQPGAPTSPDVRTLPPLENRPYRVEELVQLGYIDPNQPHNVNQLASVRQIVAAEQRQKAQLERQLRTLSQQGQQIAQVLTASERQQQMDAELAAALPHERLQIERRYAQQDIDAQRQELVQERQAEQNAKAVDQSWNNLIEWNDTYVQQDGVPEEVVNFLWDGAQAAGIRNPKQVHEYMQRAIYQFNSDRANGRVPGSTPPSAPQPLNQAPPQNFPPQQGQTFPTERARITSPAAIAPNGAGAGALSTKQMLNDFLNKRDDDTAWENLKKSLFSGQG
jgi:hypothetical protein